MGINSGFKGLMKYWLLSLQQIPADPGAISKCGLASWVNSKSNCFDSGK
jgi:hypothetical protein